MKIIGTRIDRYSRQPQGAGGSGEVAARDYGGGILVVSIDTDTGLTGVGFVSASAASAPLLAAMGKALFAPILDGANPWETTHLWDRLYHEAAPRRGGDGLMRHLLAAIDCALWDIKAKAANVPVWQLLGGNRSLVPTYANCAHHLPVEQLAERAASYVDAGHRALKIRGTRSFVTPAEATRRVAAVREAIGPDVRLMVDVNGSWDVDTAIRQLRDWEAYDVYWLEEPVPPQDLAGYRRVREHAGSTFIVGGEQHVGLAEFKNLIDSDCIDIAQPNVVMTGGITDWLRIHAYATACGVPVSPWNLQQVHIHLAAGLPNVQWIEYFMADNALLEFQGELLQGSRLEEVAGEDGVYLQAPTQPGLGIHINTDMRPDPA